jgi:hypothetical protein
LEKKIKRRKTRLVVSEEFGEKHLDGLSRDLESIQGIKNS